MLRKEENMLRVEEWMQNEEFTHIDPKSCKMRFAV